jgi:hypothetical protein
MKPSVLGIAVLTLFCASSWTKSPELSLSGGDGSSFAKAIVVKAPTDHAGVNAQHEKKKASAYGSNWRNVRGPFYRDLFHIHRSR